MTWCKIETLISATTLAEALKSERRSLFPRNLYQAGIPELHSDVCIELMYCVRFGLT